MRPQLNFEKPNFGQFYLWSLSGSEIQRLNVLTKSPDHCHTIESLYQVLNHFSLFNRLTGSIFDEHFGVLNLGPKFQPISHFFFARHHTLRLLSAVFDQESTLTVTFTVILPLWP